MSLSNIFLDALSNTLLGMGMVFVILIIIIFVIKIMSAIVRAIEEKGKKNEAPKAAAPAPAPAAHVVEEEVDDLELVAVITAAVAAAMGETSTDGFQVRSIKRAKNRNW